MCYIHITSIVVEYGLALSQANQKDYAKQYRAILESEQQEWALYQWKNGQVNLVFFP